MRTLCIIGVLVLTSACSSCGGGAHALRCDGRLRPINAPGQPAGAPVQKTPAPAPGKSLVEKP
jgi:hypothetical protein